LRSGSRSRRGGSEAIAGLLLFTILSIATFSAYLIAVERLRGAADVSESVLRLHRAIVEVAYRPGSSRLVRVYVPEGCRIEFRENRMVVYGLKADVTALLGRSGNGVLVDVKLESGVLTAYYDATFNDYTITSGYHSLIVVSRGFGVVVLSEG